MMDVWSLFNLRFVLGVFVSLYKSSKWLVIMLKANLKGRYLQGCTTKHDLERLVENVEQLNQIELNELNKPESDESSTQSEPEDDLVNETEEAESKGEPNNPKPRVEPNIVEPVELSVNHELTIPMPTSLNTMKKSKFLTMIDMWKFIHNQQ
ncbi:hypothetical protein PVK06_023829 [Gossypium arboreum]|uniref:Uncharacterized protein n=1 Tax=Gossypium arboreum TaxID=29729 RepID=A0ABR0PCP5_GOSAR|nr:hypothetical protein PVK06_023829 [Gossypium arboreum]